MSVDRTTEAFGRSPGQGLGGRRSHDRSRDPNLDRRLGVYRLERLLAQGGMGRVYLARREDEYEQKVAVKLIDPDRFSTRSLDLFYRERQILARLEHPNVARILDGGTDEHTLPYLVMEYVEGEPIDRYCESQGLSLRERLVLFQTVCMAVHFAHQNLIVHRDVKPGNILVTDDGVVKLLDFGIAKILGADGPRDTQRTVTGPWMTPSYASPEQVLGGAVSTASDVYSLGVLLCRLVSGELPYRLGDSGPARLVTAICHHPPRRPSEILASRPQPPGGRSPVAGQVAGDVDAITLKAMRKEPPERYASALQLSEDVERHLVGLPVKARQGSWLYSAQKFVRRHAVAIAFLAMIVALAISSTILWLQAEGRKAQAERAQQRAEAVAEFLSELFQAADPDATGGAAVTLRLALDEGREQLADRLIDEPEIRADLLSSLGNVYARLGLYGEARELREEALLTRRTADPTDRPELAADLNNLGGTLHRLGEHAAAERYSRLALAMWQRLGDEPNAELALRNLAATVMQQGRGEEALELHRQILDLQHRLYRADDPRVASGLYSLGALYRQQGEPAEAEPLLRRALAIYLESSGPRHTTVANVQNSLGRTLQAEGRHEEARRLLEQSLETRLALLGPEHEKVASSRKNLAALLLEMGEVSSAGELLEPALETLRRVVPTGDWRLAEAESLWGSYLTHRGRLAEAEPYLVRGHETLLRVKGEDDAVTRGARARVDVLEEARRAAMPAGPADGEPEG